MPPTDTVQSPDLMSTACAVCKLAAASALNKNKFFIRLSSFCFM
jgi:hypothetical protein